ncbi:MAG: hypothetical protein A2176_13945 [Spirochaetes bacterium RBG_13_51_14]|nr:MAG: hypothetical protein A2176_13945 [Spirochaetes bacterium RBG_13_51_14]
MMSGRDSRIVIERCRGGKACPSVAASGTRLIRDLTALSERLAGYSGISGEEERVPHRKFTLSLSLCPNGCSQPQIADIGIISAVVVRADPDACTGCGACITACRERAISLDERFLPVIDGRCLQCGDCLRACPSNALLPGSTGFRILLGGKLGRHPQLGKELPGLFSEEDVVEIVSRGYSLFSEYQRWIRLGDVINRQGLAWLPERFLIDKGRQT